jgi:phosphatidylserine/phosphatidylglycerophosphate/cardiolipin synthase-like enzyme
MTRRPPWKTIPLLLALSLPGAAPAGTIELVESFPVETDMDNPDIPDAYDVWLEMIGTAAESLAFAEFYASNEEGSRLEDIVRAVEEAARRGVSVRFLGEKGFYETYPETLDRLAATEGISVRIFDTGAVMGGVHHAKYFLVDGREAFLGSQNFDWRSLTHIQELGVRIREPSLVDGLGRIFQMDWDAAGGAPRAAGEPVPWEPSAPVVIAAGSDTTTVSLVASPEKWLPEEISWDLPRVVELMDGAASTLRVQLLTYRAVGRDKTYFDALESALRRAAAQEVRVDRGPSEPPGGSGDRREARDRPRVVRRIHPLRPSDPRQVPRRRRRKGMDRNEQLGAGVFLQRAQRRSRHRGGAL